MSAGTGLNGFAHASVWHVPAAPLPSRVVIGGAFTAAGPLLASNIAAWDPATDAWSTLGAGLNGPVFALATLANGDLVAAGQFSLAGSTPANNIARWNGTTWAPLGGGIASTVYALATLPNGTLAVGGNSGLSAWNGTTWTTFGGNSVGLVSALAATAGGELIVGGAFTAANGAPGNSIARWDGVAWHAMGAGMGATPMPPFPPPLAHVQSLAVLANGDVVAGGDFSMAGGVAANNIARWNGSSWAALGVGTSDTVKVIRQLANGDLLVGGDFFSAGGSVVGYLASWNGSAWSPAGGGAGGFVYTITFLPGGTWVVGGYVSTEHVLRWTGTSWLSLGTASSAGADAAVGTFARLQDGRVVAGGGFASIGGQSANRIAAWNGVVWSPLGTGVDGFVNAVTQQANGAVVAAGSFFNAGGLSVNGIARWNGTSWAALGTGLSGPIFGAAYTLANLANGDLVAGGYFSTAGGVAANNIARWNGTAWSALGAGLNSSALSMVTLPNGDLVVGGLFTTAGGSPANRIARWNGTTWSALGTGLSDAVASIAALPNGDLVVGGDFLTAGGVAANRIARWNGTSWLPLGSGLNGRVGLVSALPNGDVVASGTFSSAGGVPVSSVARWNGTSWSALGAGLSNPANAAVMLPQGELLLGGNFTIAGGQASTRLAKLASTCPAAAIATGLGCAGSGGANVLTPVTLPWIGSTYRALGTGIMNNGFAVTVTGFTTVSLPLAAVLPPSPVGCTLHVHPDVVEPTFTTQGWVATALALPNSASLVGVVLHQQLVLLEIDASAAFVQNTVSNAIALTIGAF